MSRHVGPIALVLAYTVLTAILGGVGFNWSLTRLLVEGVRLNREAAENIEGLLAENARMHTDAENAKAWIVNVLPTLKDCQDRILAGAKPLEAKR